MANLRAKLNKTVNEERFTLLEISGFKADYRLALLIGAALGYKLALEDFSETLGAPED